MSIEQIQAMDPRGKNMRRIDAEVLRWMGRGRKDEVPKRYIPATLRLIGKKLLRVNGCNEIVMTRRGLAVVLNQPAEAPHAK
jgi:hypothetical protein